MNLGFSQKHPMDVVNFEIIVVIYPYTEKFIGFGLINTAQQVIYAMKQPEVHNLLRKPKVNIQTYHCDGYFGLAYLCRRVIPIDSN